MACQAKQRLNKYYYYYYCSSLREQTPHQLIYGVLPRCEEDEEQKQEAEEEGGGACTASRLMTLLNPEQIRSQRDSRGREQDSVGGAVRASRVFSAGPERT